MSQIISVQIGQTGNQIGTKREFAIAIGTYWYILQRREKFILFYLSLTTLHFCTFNTSSKRTSGNRYLPRVVLADLGRRSMDFVRFSPYGRLFQRANFAYAQNGTGFGYTWAKGYHGAGAQVVENVMEIVRKEAEYTDYLKGVHVIHSMGGSTGSGLMALLMGKLRDEYRDRIMSSFTVFPSLKFKRQMPKSNCELYDAILSMPELIQCFNETFCIDNEALYNRCYGSVNNIWPYYNKLNDTATVMMSALTSSLRFPGRLDLDLYKLAFGMIPFPRQHFLTPSFAALDLSHDPGKIEQRLNSLVHEVCDTRNILVKCNPKAGLCMGATAMFRGPIEINNLETSIANIRNENAALYIPKNTALNICEIPTRGTKFSGTLLTNNTAVGEMFRRINDQFSAVFRRKAHLHYYEANGIEAEMIAEASNDLKDLIWEYEQLWECEKDLDYWN